MALHFFPIPHTTTERIFNWLSPSLSAHCVRARAKGREAGRKVNAKEMHTYSEACKVGGNYRKLKRHF